MVKKRSMMILVFSLLMGVGAAWVANNWVQARVLPAEAQDPNTASIVAAALKVPYGTKVEPRHLTLIEIHKDSVPEDSYRDMDELVGKVATQTVLRGEIMIRERFADHLGGSTLSAIVGPDMRAVAVRVNDVVGVAGFLLPGNRVDVVASRKERNQAIATTIVQDVKVLAVDQSTSIDKNDPVVVRAVTLEVTPQQAEALVKADQEGKIQLTLRNPVDKKLYMAENLTAPPPRKIVRTARAPTTTSVTLVRGTNVSTVKAKR